MTIRGEDMMRIGVIGGGVVGLHDAMLLASRGHQVTIIDVDDSRIDCINELDRISCPWIPEGLEKYRSRIKATRDYNELIDVRLVFIDVNTPLKIFGYKLVALLEDGVKSLESYIDMQPLRSAISRLVEVVTEPILLVVRTTLCFKCFRREIVGALEVRGLTLGSDIYAVYMPERLSPGDPLNYEDIQRIVGYADARSAEAARRVLHELGVEARYATVESVELSKLYENTFRLVNIAFAQESFMRTADIADFIEVVELASTKPYGFMKFYPGPYAGGHCLVKDAVMYWIATGSELVRRALIINENMPHWYASRICRFLQNRGIRKLLIHGCGYKPGVPLLSMPQLNPILRLADEMRSLCPDVEVRFYDENIVECRHFDSLDEGTKWAELVLHWDYSSLAGLITSSFF